MNRVRRAEKGECDTRSSDRNLRQQRVAFSLAETMLSVVIVGGLLVASLNTVGASTTAQSKMSDHGQGHLLAQDLMAEILGKTYEEPVDTVAFGREAGESGGARASYDDVDDYTGWTASPPQYGDGTAMANLSGWARSVVVQWVNSSDLTTVAVSESGIKRIEVTVMNGDAVAASLTALRTGTGQATRSGVVVPLGDVKVTIK